MRSNNLPPTLQSAARAWATAMRTCIPVYFIDLKAARRRFWFGPMWVVLPLMIVLLLGAGFSTHRWTGQLSGLAMPYPLYVVTGLAFWQIFVEAALMPLRRMSGFRRELIRGLMTAEQAIGVGVIDLLLMATLRLALVFGIVAAFGLPPGASLSALPIALASIAIIGLIIGLAVALPGLLVEDVGRALAFFVTVGMLVSPVFYPVHGFRFAVFNPLATLIDAARASVTGGDVNISTLLPWFTIEIVLLAALLLLVHRSKHRFLAALA